MITGEHISGRWIAVTEAFPSPFLPVFLAYLEDGKAGDEPRNVDSGCWTGSEWVGDLTGVLTGVTHWTEYPDPPTLEQMQRVLDALPAREGASDGA